MMAMTEEQEARLREDFKKIADQLTNAASAFMRGMAKEKTEMPSEPVKRTLKALREEGWTADVAEKWVAFPWKKPGEPGPPGVRKDLFGYVDVVAYRPLHGVLFVQASPETGQVSKHVAKLLGENYVEIARAIRAGIRVEIHGWGLKGERGKRKLWTRRRLAFGLDPERAAVPPGPLQDEEFAKGLVVQEISETPR